MSKRKMSVSRFAYKLSSLCGDIESAQLRAEAAGLSEIAEYLGEAKKHAMKANDAAYRSVGLRSRPTGGIQS